MKGKLTGIVLRVTVVIAMLMLLVGMIVQPAFAATINQARDPSPAAYVLNDGSATELFWWEVTWDSTPTYLSHTIEDPLGNVLETHGWDISSAPDPPPSLFNPEDPTGVNYGNALVPGSAHPWPVPAGARPGTYTSRVRFYSEEVSGTSIPPANLLDFESESAVTFFVRQPWQIFKYNDLNGNGVFNDPPETGLDGWDFTVTAPGVTTPFPGSSHTFNGTTSGGGYLVLPDVATAGTYVITETLETGWKNTDPGGVSPWHKDIVVPDDLYPAAGIPTVLFGNEELGSLDIFKFNDLDNDGIFDVGEPPLSGWSFTITGPDAYNSNGVTDIAGMITKTNLEPGNYEVTETVQPDWNCTTLNPQTKAVTTGAVTHYQFGNHRPLGSLQIFKFRDVVADGVYNPVDGETPLQGWSFSITGPGGYISGGVTDAAGLIDRVNLIPGNYIVTEAEQPNWTCTTDNPQNKAVVAEQTTYYEFGNFEETVRVPASSATGLWIMIAGFGAFIAIFGLWRTRRSLR